MLYSERTPLGGIQYGKRVVASIVRRVVAGQNGNVKLSGPRGRLSKAAQRPESEDNSFLDVRMGDGSFDIEVYLILRFGCSIKKTAADIGARLRRDVEVITGLPVARLNIIFVGVLSRNLSRRYIEVTTHAE
jgi:uncharacterized alkaline shock family protein YloU